MRCPFVTFARQGLLLFFSLLVCFPAQAQRPLGTDVSHFQSTINWTTVKNAGVVFAWAKATESTTYMDPLFTTHVANAKATGIYIGAYHFARPNVNTNITGIHSADSEAAFFWGVVSNYVTYGGSYVVPMLDWEDPFATNGRVVFNGFTTAYMSQWVNQWCNDVSNYAAASGVILRPVIYTGTWYSTAHTTPGFYPGLNSTVTNWPNWMSSYNNQNPQTGGPTTTPWPSWKIWQYSDTNWSGGDADVFNGDLTSFVRTFVIGGTNMPVITANPTNVTVAVGASATFSVTASAPIPFSYQWLFEGKVIPGATSSNYTLVNIQLTNAGGYTVAVSNAYANITSKAFLSVVAPLSNAIGSVVAPSGMVNWWTADGNPNDIFGTNNARPFNGLYYTNGEQGLAFHFDGLTSYLLPTNAPNLAPNWTLCVWVNRKNAPTASASLLGDGTYAIKLEQYNNTRQIGLTHAGVADYYFNCTVPQNVWTHLALVNNGSQIFVYTNGVFATSQLFSNSVAVTAPAGFPLPRACIGADLIASGNPIDFLQGSLDEIQTFNRALSSTEIAAIFAAGSAGFVRAPDFAGISASGNQIQLNLRGMTGKSLTLYSSTNLVDWNSLGPVLNPAGAVQYQDSPAAPQNFYRVSQP